MSLPRGAVVWSAIAATPGYTHLLFNHFTLQFLFHKISSHLSHMFSNARCVLPCVHSSFAIILMGKIELVALLSFSFWCHGVS